MKRVPLLKSNLAVLAVLLAGFSQVFAHPTVEELTGLFALLAEGKSNPQLKARFFDGLENPTAEFIDTVKTACRSIQTQLAQEGFKHDTCFLDFYTIVDERTGLSVPDAVLAHYKEASSEKKERYKRLFDSFSIEADSKPYESTFECWADPRPSGSFWSNFWNDLSSPFTPELPIPDEEPSVQGVTLDQFLTALKHPTKESFPVVKSALFYEEWRYYVDPETGLPPMGIIITSYATASGEEQDYYKELFKLLLEVNTNCVADRTNKPIRLDPEGLRDLEELYLEHDRYHKQGNQTWEHVLGWYNVKTSLEVRHEQLMQRLASVSKERKVPRAVPVVHMPSPRKPHEESRIVNHLIGAGLALVGYALFKKGSMALDTKPRPPLPGEGALQGVSR